MKSAAIAPILLALTFTVSAADLVVPVDAVKEHVNVRMEADAKSEIVGKLSQGDSLPLKRSVPGWHEVRLEDDAYGFISEDWAVVISEEAFAARQAVTEVELPRDEEEDIAEQPSEPVAVVGQAETETETETETEIEAEDVTVADEPQEAEEKPAEVVEPSVADVETAFEPAPGVEEETTVENVVVEEAVAEVVEAEEDVSAAESSPTVAVVPVLANRGDKGAQGPAGPTGPPGPIGPTGSSTIKGSENFLVKFTDSTEGGNSQIFDNGRNVGIGTTEPAQRLEVNGNIQIHERNSSVAGLMLTQSSGGMGYIMHNRADTLTLGAGSVDRMTIDRDGNVGIGMTRPSHPLEMASGAYVSAGGVWTNSSSRERKDNIVALTPEEALAALVALEPVRFNYKRDKTEEYVGFIAEDVPGLVASSDRVSLSTMDIVAVLTKVVQQQQQKIAELEARLDNEAVD